MRLGFAICTLVGLATTVAAKDPKFGFPVDCELGQTCYIQQYFDHDPSRQHTDYQCSTLSYDGHKGTDIALPTLADMQSGVDVVAAAPGKVVATRNYVDDKYWRQGDDTNGRDCGNRVGINHGGGWLTDYCHLKKGSVAVKVGDRVKMGQKLGEIGLSGRTQFPHLHFSVQNRGKVVDPFAPTGATNCAAPGQSTLWLDTPFYEPGGIIKVGFAPGIPDYSAVKAGSNLGTVDRQSEALVFWVYAFGLRENDVLEYSFKGPKGVTFDQRYTLEKGKALMLRSGGKRLRTAAWPSGRYNGVARLVRDGKAIETQKLSITLN